MPQSVSPVVPGLEPYELVLAKNQPEYNPLPVLRGKGPEYGMYSRWNLTPEEKEAIANGASIYLLQQTYGHHFQPSSIFVAHAEHNAQIAEQLARVLGFNEELHERLLTRDEP